MKFIRTFHHNLHQQTQQYFCWLLQRSVSALVPAKEWHTVGTCSYVELKWWLRNSLFLLGYTTSQSGLNISQDSSVIAKPDSILWLFSYLVMWRHGESQVTLKNVSIWDRRWYFGENRVYKKVMIEAYRVPTLFHDSVDFIRASVRFLKSVTIDNLSPRKTDSKNISRVTSRVTKHAL